MWVEGYTRVWDVFLFMFKKFYYKKERKIVNDRLSDSVKYGAKDSLLMLNKINKQNKTATTTKN